MKKTSLSIQVAVLTLTLAGATLRANNVPTAYPLGGPSLAPGQFHNIAFRDSTEAKLLRDAYIILATGDHDYAGHRAGAMQQVKAASDLLGLDVSGDGLGGKPQVLSNDRLREAKRLIVQVLGSAEVKDQRPVIKHLDEAVHQINVALGIK